MRKVSLILIIVLVTMLQAVFTGNIKAYKVNAAIPKKVILIGWDGAQRNHVKELIKDGRLPNLKALADDGTIVSIDVIRTTDTKSGWSQVLTGYEPEITGVYSNNRFQPIPKGYTIFERLENYFGNDNIITGAIIGRKVPLNAESVKKNVEPAKESRRIDKKNKAVTGKHPYFHAKRRMDFYSHSLTTNDEVGNKLLESINKYKDNLSFFYVQFSEIDTTGHKFGENSKQYSDAVISCDNWIGEIVKKLKELGIYNETMLYVTADHGFDEGCRVHTDAPYVFLATNDKGVLRNGLRQDITPTILDRFGVDISSIKPVISGNSLLKAYQQPLW